MSEKFSKFIKEFIWYAHLETASSRYLFSGVTYCVNEFLKVKHSRAKCRNIILISTPKAGLVQKMNLNLKQFSKYTILIKLAILLK